MTRSPEIPVRIGRRGDDAQFQRNMQRSTVTADRFAARVAANGRMLRGFGMAAVIAGAAAVALAKKTLAVADSIDKASRAANIGAERLQTLRFAAEQSGISTDKMDTALAKFNVTFGKVTSGMETKSSTVVKAFESLGLSVDYMTNSGLSSEQMLDEVLERLAGVENGAEQAAIAAQIFGRSAGPEMRNLLVSGVEGIRDLEKAAREGGNVISEALVSRGVEMADKWNQIMTSMVGYTYQGALQMATMLDNAFGFTDSGKMQMLTGQMDKLVSERGDALGVMREAESQLADLDKGSSAANYDAGTDAYVKEFQNRIDTGQVVLEAIEEDMNITNQQLLEMQAVKDEREARLNALANGRSAIDGEGLPDPSSGGGSSGGSSSAEYDRLAERWKSRLELVGEMQAEELNILAMAREQNLIDEDEYQQKLTQLTKEHADARTQVAKLEAAAKITTVLGAGSEVLSALGAFNDKALKASKVFGAAQALISTWQGSAEALKLPFPANIAAAAAVAAKGLALVGAIKSVSPGGGGGAPGGGGGIGSQGVRQTPLQVLASGFTADQIFTGDMIPGLFEKIQDEAGDRGYQVTFT